MRRSFSLGERERLLRERESFGVRERLLLELDRLGELCFLDFLERERLRVLFFDLDRLRFERDLDRDDLKIEKNADAVRECMYSVAPTNVFQNFNIFA